MTIPLETMRVLETAADVRAVLGIGVTRCDVGGRWEHGDYQLRYHLADGRRLEVDMSLGFGGTDVTPSSGASITFREYTPV